MGDIRTFPGVDRDDLIENPWAAQLDGDRPFSLASFPRTGARLTPRELHNLRVMAVEWSDTARTA